MHDLKILTIHGRAQRCLDVKAAKRGSQDDGFSWVFLFILELPLVYPGPSEINGPTLHSPPPTWGVQNAFPRLLSPMLPSVSRWLHPNNRESVSCLARCHGFRTVHCSGAAPHRYCREPSSAPASQTAFGRSRTPQNFAPLAKILSFRTLLSLSNPTTSLAAALARRRWLVFIDFEKQKSYG